MKKYKILITNDDGLFSFGLLPLVEELSKIGELCVIIPEKESSAISHSLTLFFPVRVKEISLNGYKIKIVSGTPADCVRLGVIEFQKNKTDIVISGINQGANLGWDVNYSGTVAAAREAVFLNKIGVAISSLSKNYDLVAKLSKKIVLHILKTKYKGFLNINFPETKPKGIKISVLGERQYEDIVHKKYDPVGLPYFWLKSKLIKSEQKKNDTDVEAVKNGFVSITPLTCDLTDYSQLEKVNKIFGL
jgi:5'-nucleotidase